MGRDLPPGADPFSGRGGRRKICRRTEGQQPSMERKLQSESDRCADDAETWEDGAVQIEAPCSDRGIFKI